MVFFAKIWSFITANITPKIIEWVGIATAVFGAWAIIKKSGETAIELKEEANTLKGVKVRDEVESDVNNLSDVDVTEQLQKRGELRE